LSVAHEHGSDGGAAAIAGGSAGIGLMTARRLAQDGARVVLLGRDASRLERAVELLRDDGAADALGLVADGTVDEEVAAAFKAVQNRWGDLNVLVNAIGPSGQGTFESLDDESWHLAFEQGALTAVRCIRHALPMLRRAKWARIVNVTAMSTQHQSPGLIAYTAVKAALSSITKNLSRSLAADGILVNAVAPGATLTAGVRRAVSAFGGDPDDAVDAYRIMAERFGSHIDLGRAGTAAEVAEVVAFCVSPRNTFMTGAHINVDGGSDFS
jgi:NAD(P)-dependent dehydrogenase (short-subunit alcohol dehydrogenase family)